MNKAIMSKEEFLVRYPQQKPVCLNYATVRDDMLALIEENEALRFFDLVLIIQNDLFDEPNRQSVKK